MPHRGPGKLLEWGPDLFASLATTIPSKNAAQGVIPFLQKGVFGHLGFPPTMLASGAIAPWTTQAGLITGFTCTAEDKSRHSSWGSLEHLFSLCDDSGEQGGLGRGVFHGGIRGAAVLLQLCHLRLQLLALLLRAHVPEALLGDSRLQPRVLPLHLLDLVRLQPRHQLSRTMFHS